MGHLASCAAGRDEIYSGFFGIMKSVFGNNLNNPTGLYLP